MKSNNQTENAAGFRDNLYDLHLLHNPIMHLFFLYQQAFFTNLKFLLSSGSQDDRFASI